MDSNEMLVFHKAKIKNYYLSCGIKAVFIPQKLRTGRRKSLGLDNPLST